MKDYTTWRRHMKSTIQNVLYYLNPFNFSSRTPSKSSSSAKTRTPSHDTLQVWHSLFPERLKHRIIRRRSQPSSKSTRLIYTTEYQLQVTLVNGVERAYCCGTLSQVLEKVLHWHTIGMSGLTLHVKSSPNFPHREGSFLLFSERWPSVTSRMWISPKTPSWLHHTPHRGAPSTVEIHSSGRVYSLPSTTS